VSFDFPNTPTVGQTYKPIGGPTFRWSGTTWTAEMAGVPVSVYVADSAPPNPAVGQLWWDSDSGNLFIWFADPDSTQWVQVSGMPATAKPTALARNRIVNGAFQHSQENGNTTSSVSTYFLADQWQGLHAGMTGNYFVRGGAAPYFQGGIGGVMPVAAGNYGFIQQLIEGGRVADFLWGAADAKQVILRFESFSQLGGSFAVSIHNSAVDRSYVAPFTLPVAAWTTVTLAIPGDTTGTWLTTTGLGMGIRFCFGTGTSLQGVAGWQAGNKLGLATTTNGFSSAASNYIRNVGLYLDPDNTGLAPPWQMPDEAEELRACQRYWELLTGGFRWDHALTVGVSTGFTHKFAATKRIVPAAATSVDALSGWTLQGYEQIQTSQLVINAAPLAAGPAARVGNINVKVNARM